MDGETIGQHVYQGSNHAPFTLKSGGETLTLTYFTEEVVDNITFPSAQIDWSYGRYPDGNDMLTSNLNPTPNNANQLRDSCALFEDLQNVCEAKSSYCEAIVHTQHYDRSCDGYCSSHGTQCLNAWNDADNSCHGARISKPCSQRHWNDLICRCGIINSSVSVFVSIKYDYKRPLNDSEINGQELLIQQIASQLTGIPSGRLQVKIGLVPEKEIKGRHFDTVFDVNITYYDIPMSTAVYLIRLDDSTLQNVIIQEIGGSVLSIEEPIIITATEQSTSTHESSKKGGMRAPQILIVIVLVALCIIWIIIWNIKHSCLKKSKKRLKRPNKHKILAI